MADPVAIPLESDPAYLAFLRTSGLAQQQAAAAYQQRAAQMNAALQASIPGMQQEFGTQQRNLAGSAESRGMLASGQYLRDSSELAGRQAQQVSNAQNQTASQIADLGYNLANQVAQQQQSAANAGLSAAGRINSSYGSSATDPADPAATQSGTGY